MIMVIVNDTPRDTVQGDKYGTLRFFLPLYYLDWVTLSLSVLH
jgi:hypothetical protein